MSVRTATDTRVTKPSEQLSATSGIERAALNRRLAEVRSAVRAESSARSPRSSTRCTASDAVEVSAADAISSAAEPRPRITEAIERMN